MSQWLRLHQNTGGVVSGATLTSLLSMTWPHCLHSIVGLLTHFCLLGSKDPEALFIFLANLWLSIIQDVLQKILNGTIRTDKCVSIAVQPGHHFYFYQLPLANKIHFQNVLHRGTYKEETSSNVSIQFMKVRRI